MARKAPETVPELDEIRDSEEIPILEENAPTAEEMASYLGAPDDLEEDGDGSDLDDRPLPSLAEAEAMISPKTKALMDELFRAKLENVKRIDPKLIR